MSTASMSKVSPTIPKELPQLLHFPKTPWHISPSLFERMKKQLVVENAAGKPFVAVPITNEDPEYAFVLSYFNHQKL